VHGLSTHPGMPEPAASARAFGKSFNDFKPCLHDGHKHQLGDAIAGFNGEGVLAAVEHADHQWPLIVGINEPGAVAKDDAVFVAEPGARQDDGAQARVADMDGKPGGDEFSGTWGEGERGVQGSAQVKSGAGGGGVGGKWPVALKSRVKDADLQGVWGHHGGSGLQSR